MPITDAREAARNAIESVLEARQGESLLVVCDDVRRDVGQVFAEGAMDIGLWTRLLLLESGERVVRSEVPAQLMEIVNSVHSPDIYINLLRGPADETPFRVKIIKLETRKGRSRLGHCPGITMDMLTDGALAMSKEEHSVMQNHARSLLAKLQDVERVHLTAPGGSDFTVGVSGRTWFSDTYVDWKTMKWMNLPTGEVLVGPVENSMEGVVVCDLAVGGIGPLSKPMRLDVRHGRVVSVACDDRDALRVVEQTQATDEMAKHIGEFAIGLNPKARLVKEFLEAEKVRAVHVAFGNNTDYPGVVANNSATHQDFLINRPTVTVVYGNGTEQVIMRDGALTL
ncbi:MAG: aminopeptidase [Candidatus Thorarchaeota archaeon]|nr:aminopeptidase [Candidatus Thorarchaeota archaeon]